MIEREYKIQSYDVYPSYEIKPSAMMRYMQQCAREDCDEQGLSYDFLRSMNAVFVIAKSGLEFYRPIKVDEIMTVRTFNNDVDGVLFDREFDFFVGGDRVAHASTFWVLIKFDTRTIVRPKDLPVEFKSLHLDCKKVEVPRAFLCENLTEKSRRTVRVSDLDQNNHLNNCVYADIALDNLDFDGTGKSVKSVKTIFRREARLKDVLKVSVGGERNKAVVTAENVTDGKRCFEAEIEFFD